MAHETSPEGEKVTSGVTAPPDSHVRQRTTPNPNEISSDTGSRDEPLRGRGMEGSSNRRVAEIAELEEAMREKSVRWAASVYAREAHLWQLGTLREKARGILK